jgi:AI-2 transport protein TqsA
MPAPAVGLSTGLLGVVAWPAGRDPAIPLTLLVKALLVDIDPRAKWADALLRASAKEPDPVIGGRRAPPAKKAHRPRHGHEQPAAT